MAKTCTYENCNYPVFGKNFCKSHQHLRPDYKKPSFKRSSVNKQSDKLKDELKEYRSLKAVFMKANPRCAYHGCGKPSTDLHHMKGRGVYLNVVAFWKALCREHHDWATENSKEAIEQGISISRLNKQP